jgi:hypothetical protein
MVWPRQLTVNLEVQCLSEKRCALTIGVRVMSTSVYTGLKQFNLIRRHVVQICVRKVAVNL